MMAINSVSLFRFKPFSSYRFTGYRFALFYLMNTALTKLNREKLCKPKQRDHQDNQTPH